MFKFIYLRRAYSKNRDIIAAYIGSFFSIAMIGVLQHMSFDSRDNIFLIGSFGASAVLIYGARDSDFSQTKNLVGGHLISAVVGVTVALLIDSQEHTWLCAALAVSTAIFFMQLTDTIHPPGGATALIAVIGSHSIKDLGYFYVLNPVLSGVLILLVVSIIVNFLIPKRL